MMVMMILEGMRTWTSRDETGVLEPVAGMARTVVRAVCVDAQLRATSVVCQTLVIDAFV